MVAEVEAPESEAMKPPANERSAFAHRLNRRVWRATRSLPLSSYTTSSPHTKCSTGVGDF